MPHTLVDGSRAGAAQLLERVAANDVRFGLSPLDDGTFQVALDTPIIDPYGALEELNELLAGYGDDAERNMAVAYLPCWLARPRHLPFKRPKSRAPRS